MVGKIVRSGYFNMKEFKKTLEMSVLFFRGFQISFRSI